MNQYTFHIDNPSQHYIRISAQFLVSNETTNIQLPAWRPGRYELANFAKNIRNFNVFNEDGKKCSVHKISKDCWQANTSGTKSITVEYLFFANELNAGSTFLDRNQLYVNPVNCCVFVEETYNSAVGIDLRISKDWQVASSMRKEGKLFTVDSVEELFDTPFIASAQLQHASYESYGTLFHIWFNGEVKPDWKRLLKDFQAFTDSQIEKFTEFPVKEYHFLNQILPIKSYHGVEHQKSTVISLGPSYEIFGDLYKELLGVSSHELYHTWNVKAIRPIEMYPYDFTKENYSELGYICEGVTTYQGDLFLMKSGVFSEEQYLNELTVQLQKHFDNQGRFNYSVAESSFDTWLDGYVMGAPGRKVSIYTEGCLLAFVMDVRIRKITANKKGLDDVMRRLYSNYALKNRGVSAADYQAEIENLAGESFQEFFDDYVNDCKPYESILTDAFDYLGLELVHVPSAKYSEGRLGMKTLPSGANFKIYALYPGGPAEAAELSIGDEIIAVNGLACNSELDKWLEYFDNDLKTVTVIRGGVLREFTFPEVMRNFYNTYSIKKIDNPTHLQKGSLNIWKS
ncbi:MAG: PDZ domain-containing protein [Crocinitomicaceae bacterium]|nr:PDZ domain-containing protein [Crocinitomicaceae bacterium]